MLRYYNDILMFVDDAVFLNNHLFNVMGKSTISHLASFPHDAIFKTKWPVFIYKLEFDNFVQESLIKVRRGTPVNST